MHWLKGLVSIKKSKYLEGGCQMEFVVYLAGEIHSNWRQELKQAAEKENLPLSFVSPQTNHDLSDAIGEKVLGEQHNNYYKDDKASDINNFRTSVLLRRADIVIAKFGEDYRQWNTAMDATTAINRGVPLIIIRPESLIHSIKELSNKANVTVESIDQAIEVLNYLVEK